MNKKHNNMLDDTFPNSKDKLDKELFEKFERLLQEVAEEMEAQNPNLEEAYELLEKAEEASSKTKAIKYAKEAYEKYPECLDAALFLTDNEKDPIKKWEILNNALEKEKKRLEKENYFTKSNVGNFYSYIATRPYIRGLYSKACYLIADGKMKQASNVCKEILRLDKIDDLGARFMLMALYAFFEQENELVDLFNKYPSESLEGLFPLFALYFKQGNNEKAQEYLERINKANPYFVKAFKGKLDIDEETIEEGYFTVGEESEVAMYVINYTFLIITMPTLSYYVVENSKKKK